MRGLLMFTTTAIAAAAMSTVASAAIKEITYPAIKVDITPLHTPDAAFEKMRKELSEAAAKKDINAVLSLVGPTFVWLSGGGIGGQFDFGRDSQHNFKVVFALREPGKD